MFTKALEQTLQSSFWLHSAFRQTVLWQKKKITNCCQIFATEDRHLRCAHWKINNLELYFQQKNQNPNLSFLAAFVKSTKARKKCKNTVTHQNEILNKATFLLKIFLKNVLPSSKKMFK